MAKDVAALKRRIRKGVSEIPPAIVQTFMESVRTKLLQAWRVGVLLVCHLLNMFKIIYFNPAYYLFYQKIKILILKRVPKLVLFFSYHPLTHPITLILMSDVP